MGRMRNIVVVLGLSLGFVAACDDEEEEDAAATDGSADGGSCDVYAFEYAGQPENGSCPQLECCPGQLDGNFSAVSGGMCLSAANCEAVCEDPDAAFDCLF